MATTRRQLLIAGTAAGLGIAACGDDDDDSERTDTISEEQAESDAALLNNLLDLEHTAVAAYTAALRELRGGPRAAIEGFASHERAHAAELGRAVRRLGGSPSAPRPPEEYAAGFPTLGSRVSVLEFLLDVESTSVAAYLDALPKIGTPELRSTATAIVTTEAEQMSVLLGELGRPQASGAFVTGEL